MSLADPSGLGFLDGFDELIVRCGLESNGAPEFDVRGILKYPLHGRIANRPASKVELTFDDAEKEIRLTGIVDETRVLFRRLQLRSTISTRLGEPGLRIHDEVINLGATPQVVELLYHINFGPPLLEAGSRVVAPVAQLVPRDPRAAEGIDSWDRYPGPEAGYSEQVYFADLVAGSDHRTHVLLENAAKTLGVSVGYDKRQMPCFTLWKNTAPGRRICDRPGAGNQLSQSAVVRRDARPSRQAGGRRNGVVRSQPDNARRPSKRGRGRKSGGRDCRRQHAARFANAAARVERCRHQCQIVWRFASRATPSPISPPPRRREPAMPTGDRVRSARDRTMSRNFQASGSRS